MIMVSGERRRQMKRIKTKQIFAYKRNATELVGIDEAINEFLEENEICEDRLIDIKLGSVGYFQFQDTGEIESSALIIYRA
jgi:hypothetical protein